MPDEARAALFQRVPSSSGFYLYVNDFWGKGGYYLIVTVRIVAVADRNVGGMRKRNCHAIRHKPRIVGYVAHIFVSVKWYFGIFHIFQIVGQKCAYPTIVFFGNLLCGFYSVQCGDVDRGICFLSKIHNFLLKYLCLWYNKRRK
jgi:hypothetical protein